jgi:hypothetical protein
MEKEQQTEIYHYKDEDGNWVPFSCTADEGKEWNKLCQTLMLLRKDSPHPNHNDYLKFRYKGQPQFIVAQNP